MRTEKGGVMCRSAPVPVPLFVNWGTTNVGGQKPAINKPPSNIGKSFTFIQPKKRLDCNIAPEKGHPTYTT